MDSFFSGLERLSKRLNCKITLYFRGMPAGQSPKKTLKPWFMSLFLNGGASNSLKMAVYLSVAVAMMNAFVDFSLS